MYPYPQIPGPPKSLAPWRMWRDPLLPGELHSRIFFRTPPTFPVSYNSLRDPAKVPSGWRALPPTSNSCSAGVSSIHPFDFAVALKIGKCCCQQPLPSNLGTAVFVNRPPVPTVPVPGPYLLFGQRGRPPPPLSNALSLSNASVDFIIHPTDSLNTSLTP